MATAAHDPADQGERPAKRIFKTILGSLAGAVGGALLMYLNPIVTSVIKPAKPVPNFSFQAKGLTAQFQNRSTGGTEGWWDFGDGSALEPFDPKQPAIAHTFPQFGSYNVKLTLYNVIREETERTVSVNLDSHTAAPPAVEDFTIVSASNDPNPPAPATFRVYAKVKNADLVVWTLGTERPVEVSTDAVGIQDRLVTFKEYGWHTVRVVAVGNKQVAEQSKTIFVGVPSERPAPGAYLQVAYDAVQVETKAQTFHVPIRMPADQEGTTWNFREERAVPDGWRIVDLKAKQAPQGLVKNADLAISPDRTRFTLKGELVKSTGLFAGRHAQQQWLAEVAATLERRSDPATRSSDPIFANLAVPGRTTLAMPKLPGGWQPQKRKLSLEVRDGASVVWRDSKVPSGGLVEMQNRRWLVTATEIGDQIVVDVADGATLGFRPSGN